MDLRLVLAISSLFFAGCMQDNGGNVAPTTSMTHPPKPEQVFERAINGCPGSGTPAQTSASTGRFEVKPGYDQIIIAFHSSGEGTGGGEIRWEEEGNKLVWQRPSTERVSSAPALCGGHAHTGGGETKMVEAGNYTVRLTYTGPVAIHLIVTAMSSKAADASNHTHFAT